MYMEFLCFFSVIVQRKGNDYEWYALSFFLHILLRPESASHVTQPRFNGGIKYMAMEPELM